MYRYRDSIVVVRSTLRDTTPIVGSAIVVDTFRAFTTAAYAFAQGVESIYLTDSVSHALDLATEHGFLTMGEVGGRKPAEFELSNSPWEITQRDDLEGVTLVHRSSAGTRGALHAVRLGAVPVFVSSLVVASATVRAACEVEMVTIVAAGLHGETPTDEDEATAALLAAQLRGRPARPAEVVADIRGGQGAKRLRAAQWSRDEDLDLCLAIDRFDFAMRVSEDVIGVRIDQVS